MPNRTRILRDDDSASPIRGIVGREDAVEIPHDLIRLAQRLQATREARATFFAPYMFGEPAWDVLLALYIAHGRGYPMKVTDLCFEAAAAPTTVIRWIDYLVENGHATKRGDKFDGRVTYVELTPRTALLLNQCLRRMTSIFNRS